MLTLEQQAQLETLLSRRQRGEPVAHLVGEREFWSLPLLVSPQRSFRARIPNASSSRRWRGCRPRRAGFWI